MGIATQDQILDKAVWISPSSNSLGKGMNPTRKIIGLTDLFNIGMATGQEGKF